MRASGTAAVVLALCVATATTSAAADSPTQQWGIFEVVLPGGPTTAGNPFLDVTVHAVFTHASGLEQPVRPRGFYDGDGTWRVRLMPHVPGNWSYTTQSNAAALDGKTGTFIVASQTAAQLGQSPVQVRDYRTFEHADGASHFSVGTTSYAWIHQNQTMIDNTVATLSDASTPFNKMRMTIFPKHYLYNHNNPAYFPYDGWLGDFDFTMFNVSFWQRLDQRLLELQSAGVQADIIIFHPYDDHKQWNFSCMGGDDPATYDTTNDENYIRYLVARVAAYHNVWWSMANEWDLVQCKSLGIPTSSPTWDRLFEVLSHDDPYAHLTSVHNCVHLYNYSRPWITHISNQGGYDMGHIKRNFTPKPIVWDEVMYEGDIGMWGGLTPGQMVDRFWWGLSYGLYTGHGETYLLANTTDDDQVLWWSKGNVLRGESPPMIGWFASVARQHFDRLSCTCTGWGDSMCDPSCLRKYVMGDGVNLVTDEETVYFVHSSAYNNPPHRAADSMLQLPPGRWVVKPVDMVGMQVLPPVAMLQGGAIPVNLTGTMITFEALTTNATLAPCKRSGASCCSSDKYACTPYTAMLTLAA